MGLAVLNRRTFLAGSATVVSMGAAHAAPLTRYRSDEQTKQGFDALMSSQFMTPDNMYVSMGQFSGRFVIANFWAYWCPNCLEEFASLRRFQISAGGPSKLGVLLISQEQNWSQDLNFARQHKLPFPISYLRNPTSRIEQDKMIAMILAIRDGQTIHNTLPVSYVVGPRGEFDFYQIGALDWTSNIPALSELRNQALRS